MKKILIGLTILSIFSCKSSSKKDGSNGQVYSNESNQSFKPIRPIGMVPVSSGSFVLGQADYDFTQKQNAPTRSVTVSAFYIDDTEITNSEYRIFVDYVRDSIVRNKLAEKAQQSGKKGEEGLGKYAYKNVQDEEKSKDKASAYDEYLKKNSTGRDGDLSYVKKLNWDVPIIYKKESYPDVEYAETLESMYYPPAERFNNERVIDARQLKYKYTWIDTDAAARERGARKKYVKNEIVNIYPDTTVWTRDYNYAHNEPMLEYYFSHKAYVQYPVVGVKWLQAMAFCAYRTTKHNLFISKKKNKDKVFAYRLPTEIEWEYAARGGLENAAYPWGGPYLTGDRGCFLANFKPKRGDYIEDHEKGNFLYTGKVKSFPPNGYGLYDMAGNVSEWTQSPFDNAGYETASTMNPYLGVGESEKEKVVRGGSWKDVGYMLMCGARDHENMDSARSYIGFRTVQTIPEGAKVDFKKTRVK